MWGRGQACSLPLTGDVGERPRMLPSSHVSDGIVDFTLCMHREQHYPMGHGTLGSVGHSIQVAGLLLGAGYQPQTWPLWWQQPRCAVWGVLRLLLGVAQLIQVCPLIDLSAMHSGSCCLNLIYPVPLIFDYCGHLTRTPNIAVSHWIQGLSGSLI